MIEEQNNFFKTNRELIVFTVLSLLVLAIYWQTTGFGFINLDDNLYVYENSSVLSGVNQASVKWALTAFHSANWHPLTWLSHELDVQLFGLNAGGHHAVNIIFHLINSLLAFAVFRKMTGSFIKSAFLAALFAVHPAHVESVAWIAERKDVLSTLFWLLTMWAYLRFAESKVSSLKSQVPGEETIIDDSENETSSEETTKPETLGLGLGTKFYALTILLFALGLMAKPMLVTLPFVLLLMDFWSLERLKTLKDLPALLIEKIPFFALSAVSAYLTVLAQRSGGAVETLEFLPLGTRFLNALVSYAKYVAKLFYPADLALWYPYEREFPAWQIGGAALLMLGITILCLRQIKTRKYLLMGWLWFLGTLVPVIGIVQVGSQSLADRYTYIPYFGLFIMLVWGVNDIFKNNKKAFFAIFGIAVIAFSAVSFKQVSFWKTSETIYRRTLAVTQKNFLISHNLCYTLTLEDRLDEAEPLCRDVIVINPDYFEVYNTLGVLQIKRGQFAEAEKSFQETLRRSPNYATAYSNLALAQVFQGKPEEAEASLQKASELNTGAITPPIFVTALNDLAAAYAKQQKFEKAAENFNRALYLAPDRADIRAEYALALAMLKRYDEAQKQIEDAIRQSPNLYSVYNIQGLIFLEQNKKAEAVRQFEKSLQLKPDDAEAAENLKKASK